MRSARRSALFDYATSCAAGLTRRMVCVARCYAMERMKALMAAFVAE